MRVYLHLLKDDFIEQSAGERPHIFAAASLIEATQA